MKSRRVYLAAPYYSVAATRPIAKHIEAAGHTITSRWLSEPESGSDKSAYCRRDFDDIESSDAFLLLNDEHPFNGRHVEAGYALALTIPVIVLGPASNIFYQHLCRSVTSIAEALEVLAEVSGAAHPCSLPVVTPECQQVCGQCWDIGGCALHDAARKRP